MQCNTTLQYAAATSHKLAKLIMGCSILWHASMASSCDWKWDILDREASRVMALQLALELLAQWLTQVQLNRSGHCSSDRLYDETDQTKLPAWLASTKVMNDKYHGLTAWAQLNCGGV